MNKPAFVDIAENQSEKSTMQSVTELQDTQNAIIAYNNALKPARKKKDALPEITTANLTMRDRFVKEPKKGKIVRELRYHKVGNLDEGVPSSLNDDKFSISAKTRAI
jgi:glutaredoxin 2